MISDVEVTQLVAMIRQYGMEFKEALVYDRIREELRIFCANHTIDEVYNTMFLVGELFYQLYYQRSLVKLSMVPLERERKVLTTPLRRPTVATSPGKVYIFGTLTILSSSISLASFFAFAPFPWRKEQIKWRRGDD